MPSRRRANKARNTKFVRVKYVIINEGALSFHSFLAWFQIFVFDGITTQFQTNLKIIHFPHYLANHIFAHVQISTQHFCNNLCLFVIM